MRFNKFYLWLILPAALLVFLACSNAGDQGQQSMSEKTARPDIQKAVAVLHPTLGNDVTGVVTFAKTANGIEVIADIDGLTPGKHGFHIHEYGDCSAGDATSAGGHFNPNNMPHGNRTEAQRHVGDLGNIVADSTGKAHLEWTDMLLAFSGPNDIIGRAVVVHGGEDDLQSQPSGNAGPRVACGVIGIAQNMPKQ
jgi:Cu-Zn family superoxide dismutase